MINFIGGALEVALLYAIAYLLRHFRGLHGPFFLFAAMVVLFVLVDLLKYVEYVDQKRWSRNDIAPRQLLRLVAIVAALLGGLNYLTSRAAAWTLLVLVFVYMALTGWARWKAAKQDQPVHVV